MSSGKISIRKKLVIVGDGCVGKTCLLYTYCNNKFFDEYEATLFETYVTHIETDTHKIEFILWDTAGQEEYERLRPISYTDSDVILLCYSIDNPTSLKNIGTKWNPEIKFYCPTKPVILVGNKKDLRNDPNVIKELRNKQQEIVRPEQGKNMANRIGAVNFFECSAKTRQGLNEIFAAAAKESFKYNSLKNADKSSKKCNYL